jgi:transcriptional regulator with XRE-family HTH domain
MINKIGENIKGIRKSKGFTLQDISDATELSLGYLSKLERNLSSPTIANLQKICSALDITMTELVSSFEDDKILVKKNDRKTIFESKTKVKYEMTTEGARNLEGVCMIVDDNSKENISYKHRTDEFGIVTKGSMEMTINGSKYLLEEGDAIYIEAESAHSFKKIGKGECISYWTYLATKGDRTEMIPK